jgi:hypothetical protein
MDVRPPPLSRLRSWLLPLAIPLLALGCGAHNCELVEAELRDREVQISQLKHELERRDAELRGLQLGVERLERHPAAKLAEPPALPCAVQRIVLGKMTGGHDADPRCPGDEGIVIYLEPHDVDDHSVKAPGVLHIEAFEVNQQGLKTPLSAWEVPERELRKYWETPVLGSPAYRVPLLWQQPPTTEKLRVVVRFVSREGLPFEADRDITIHPPPQIVPRTSKPPAVDEQLHPPRPVEPDSELAPASWRPSSNSQGVRLARPVPGGGQPPQK